MLYNGWPIPTTTNQVAEKLFTEFSTDGECCLDYSELMLLMESVSALRPDIIIENIDVSEIDLNDVSIRGI